MDKETKQIDDVRDEAALRMHDALIDAAERLVEGVTVEMPAGEQVERLESARKFSQVAFNFYAEVRERAAREDLK